MSKKPIKLTPNQQQQIETIFKAFGGNCWVRVGDDVLYNNEEALVMMNGANKICGNCEWWNFKLGGLPDGKEWGECTNPKYYESMRVSDRLVDYGKITDIEDSAHYLRISNQVTNYMRVQHEEKSFGCIYFEGKQYNEGGE